MKNAIKSRIRIFIPYFMLMLLTLSGMERKAVAQMELRGSTPGDLPIKRALNLPEEKAIDFMKWKLVMSDSPGGRKMFVMQLHYGVSQPNTSGFTSESATSNNFSGSYTVEKVSNDKINAQIIQLKCASWKAPLRLAKMNENVYHLLTQEEQPMVGNGGWSYSLFRQNPVKESGINYPEFSNAVDKLSDTSQMIFVGRTPCQDFAGEYNVKVSQECFKLKWKLVLKKDHSTGAPASFWMRNVVYGKVAEVEGKWKIIKGNKANPDLTFIQLNPDHPIPMTFLVENQSVLFLLHKNGTLFEGNADFGYALNMDK
jgi:hypothetical protein